MVNVSVVGDDFLNDRRSDLRWWWRWWWRRGRRSRRPLFCTSNDDLVFDDFTFARGRRGLASTHNELLTLSGDQIPTVSRRRRETPLAATMDHQRVLMHFALSPVTAVLTMLVAECDALVPVVLVVMGARRRSALSEPDVFTLDFDFTWPGWGAITTTKDDVLTLDLTLALAGLWRAPGP